MKSNSTDRTKPGYSLTEAQIEQLRALEGRVPDTVDIPPAPESNWATAVRGKHHAAMQETVSVRLDPDVLGWLSSKGPRYESEINRILREYMETEAAK